VLDESVGVQQEDVAGPHQLPLVQRITFLEPERARIELASSWPSARLKVSGGKRRSARTDHEAVVLT
jgi:hypothetical protein